MWNDLPLHVTSVQLFAVFRGATEKAGLELKGPTNFGGWKMQDWN